MSTVYGQYAAYGLGSDTADDWRALGLCRQADPELFFPLGGHGNQRRTGANLDQELRAKAVCHSCPAMEQCGKEAIARGEEHGIFGGLNERERRELGAPRPTTGRNFVAANAARVEQQGGMCRKGLHEVTPENTYTHEGYSTCAPCRIDSQRAYRLKLRAVANV